MAKHGAAIGGGPLGIAASGGSDSTALMVLAADWTVAQGRIIRVATVDHGLRPESAAEAAGVAALCARWGLPHDTLVWRDGPGPGNLSDQARRARIAMLSDWARSHGIHAVALGHTRDDQAETVLLRLARGSGVDGLSAMQPLRRAAGIAWLRPLLDETRVELRAWLAARQIGWVEDPSNDDTRRDRVRVRRVLALLAPLGIDAAGLTATAVRMTAARRALEDATAALARDAVREASGDLLIDAARLARAPAELRDRLVSQALMWIASQDYRPRFAALTALQSRIAAGRGGTLAGCLVRQARGTIRISREPQAVMDAQAAPGALWDRRWRVAGPFQPGDVVAALGVTGIAACPDWRVAGLPRASLIASPAVWRSGVLVAAPLAGSAGDWTAKLAPGCDSFLTSILSH